MKKKLKIKIYLIVLFITYISIGYLASNLQISSHKSSLIDNKFNLNVSSSEYGNALLISDGNNGIVWNDGDSEYPNIALDGLGNLHIVWKDDTDGIWGTDDEIMYCTYSSSSGWSFPEVISDGFNDIYWNDGWSVRPDLAIDSSNNIHVVWSDGTEGIWGTDLEIMYACYTEATGWSNITVISDGYNDIYWNDGWSNFPSIAIDKDDRIHVVWMDDTDGIWGTDPEIMYVSYSTISGWSNASVISDGHNNIYWNDQDSYHSDLAIDSSNNLHVVWQDDTDGIWGIDFEIMYTEYSSASGWSLPVVIVDNSGASEDPCITIDPNDNVHVAWRDYTPGDWGTDAEIMYAKYTKATGWSNITVISDGYNGIYWNDGMSRDPSIIADAFKAHVVWDDDTDGSWGSDNEIMYTYILIPSTKGSIPFSNLSLLFTFVTILGLIFYLKKKTNF